jgi:hypothetical protein
VPLKGALRDQRGGWQKFHVAGAVTLAEMSRRIAP